jgi:ATP-binding cassette subfamily B protein
MTRSSRQALAKHSPLRRVGLELLLASILLNVFSLVMPLTVLQVYDRIVPRHAAATLGVMLLGVVGALLLDLIVRSLRVYITGWAAVRFEHSAVCTGFRKLLESATLEYEREGSGVYQERLRAAAHVRDFYSGQAALALLDLPFVLLYLVLIWFIADWLVVVPIALLAAFSIATLYNGRKLRKQIDERTTHDERRFSFIADALSGIHTIKAMALEAIMQRRYERLQDTNVQQSFKGAEQSIRAVGMGTTFSQLSTIAVAAVGAGLVVSGHLTPGSLSACILLAGRSLQPLQSALSSYVRLQGLTVAQKQLHRILDFPPSPQAGKPPLPRLEGALRVEGVKFQFPGAEAPLFQDVSLAMEPGEVIAITGDSGTGKSTLLSLMCGMLSPTEGRVLVDGRDLSEHSTEGRYRQIAYVPQQGTLFNGSILDNVTMFDPSLEDAAHAIAAQIGLDRSVAAMRDGWETQVGNTAADILPAGLRQRIAIARALLHHPKVVLFDEANIAIDRAGDDHLRDFLAKLKGGHTLVMVTNRPSLLKLADRIFAIRDGHLEPQTIDAIMEPQAIRQPLNVVSHERPSSELRPSAQLVSTFPVPTDLSMCLMALLTALEWRGSPRNLAEALPHFADTLDLTGFRQVMANLGFTMRSERVDLATVDPRLMPCLFLPDDGDAQVLLRVEDDGALTAFEGGSLKLERLPAKSDKGELQFFSRAEKQIPPPLRDSWVQSVLGRFHGLVWMGLALSVGINLLGLAAPMFVMTVYNRIVPSGDVALVPYLALGASLALIVEWMLRRLRGQVLSYIGARLDFIIGNNILQKLLALPAWSTETLPVGSQLSRIKDFESWRDLLVGPMALLFYDMPATLVFVGVLAILNPWMLLVLLISGAGFVVLGMATRPVTTKLGSTATRAGAVKNEFLADALAKMRAIRHAGAEDRWYDRFALLSARYADREFKSQQHTARVAILAQGWASLTAITSLAAAVIATFDDPSTSGLVIITMMLVWRLTGPLQHGFLSLAMVYRVFNSMRQIDNLMRMRPDRDITAVKAAPPAPRGEVSFARVSFRYSNDADPALLGVSLKVLPGQVVAIAGPNGAGKSTLVKLITGIYTPQAGSVRIDNVDIRQIEPGTLRSLISYMPQRCEVFYGTVAQNLRLVHPLATDEELKWATGMAGILDDIMEMPRGFDTRISDGKADQLPYGFRQRLGLARTYLRPAPVIVFDEPGNGLDNDADMLFQRALNYMRGKATVFIVSHRPSHLKLADVVVLMEDGYVRQVGSYEQVSPLIMKL